MIRGTLCAFLIILSILPAIPLASQPNHYQPAQQAHALPVVPGHDPNGTRFAFNTSRAQFDLYTVANATVTPGTPITPYGNNFTNPQTGATVPGTTFNVTIPNPTPSVSYNVTFDKILNVPKGNVSSTTYLRFDWRGTTGNFTEARYVIYNDTTKAPIFPVVKNFNQTAITGGQPMFTGGSPPVGCGPNDNCYDVTKYLGFNLTLVFAFNSTSLGKGLSVRVSNIAIVSADGLPINSYSHSMALNPEAPSTKTVNHQSDILIPTGYFANVTYPKPNSGTGHLNHTWSNMILSFYYPSSYSSVVIVRNGTAIFNATATPPPFPVFQSTCPSFFFCKASTIVSTSNPMGTRHALIIITANSNNLAAKVETTLGGVPTSTWGTGDLLQVRVTLRQGVNVTGSDYVTANRTSTQVKQTFSNTKEGVSLLNFTTPIPSGSSLFGTWTVNSTFTNNYDLGYNATTFTLQQLAVTQFSYSGSNQQLNTQGTLTYSPTNSPNIVNGYVFAIDNGAEPGPITTPTITSGTGVYISNISQVNGVFTSGQQLMMVVTLINPTSGTRMNSNANLTIYHEYVSGTTHGSNVTISLPQGYDTFTLNSKYVYELNATFTPAGIRVFAKGLNVGGSSVTALLPPGNPPVTGLRQHSGLFKISISTEPLSGTGACVPSCTNSIESPPYAYVLVSPPVPGRLLASGSFTSSSTTGAFSATLSSGRILGATKLTFLTLGIDPSGFAITVQGQSSQESTLLQSTLDSIPSVTQSQATTLVLHLKSNSTTLNMSLNITLSLQDSTLKTVVTATVSGITISPGQQKDVQFSFTSPPSVGAYSVTFFSAQYGAPLITGTLQVAALQSNLQILVPAIIGVAAAILILLFFLFRKKPELNPETTTKDKPASGKPKPSPGSTTSKSLT